MSGNYVGLPLFIVPGKAIVDEIKHVSIIVECLVQ